MELQNNKEQNYIFAGPLNLNRITRQASTVMSGNIALAYNDFEALYTLAANEGKFLSFQQIYEAAWGKSETTETPEEATATLAELVDKINQINEEFMWIEHTPEKGYKLKTRWGHNWTKRTNRNSSGNKVTNITDTTANTSRNQRKPIKTLITGVGALVAIIMLALLYILHSTGVITPQAPGPVYIESETEIENPEIPLAPPNLED